MHAALGCGTALITNYNEQYEKLGFMDGHNCLMYDSLEELRLKLDVAQNDAALVASIAEQGQILAKTHTYDVRAKELLKIYREMR